jgi:hypothetical protein
MQFDDDFDRISVPFTLGELYQGLAEGHGILRIERDALVLEFQVRDAVFGVLKTDVRELRIPFDDIVAVDMRKRWWVRSLRIRTHSLRVAAAIPGLQGGDVVIRIKQRDLLEARLAVSRLALLMSEARLRRIEGW